MADYGVANTWVDVKPGREKQAMELFGTVTMQYEQAVKDGRLDSWDVILFEPNGAPGAPGGAFRAYGTQDQVETFIRSDEFAESASRAQVLLTGFGYRRFIMNDALMKEMGTFATVLDSI
jgi:hypothetical protein